MGFWIYMLVIDMLIPVTMLGFGWRFLHKAPDQINNVFGYRTNMSMQNRETWELAHRVCGKIWFLSGLVLLPLSIAAMLCMIGGNTTAVGYAGAVVCLVQLLFLVGTIPPTEYVLRKHFDANGNRRK